jgi:SAM-dependent methyltransferase
MSSVHHSAAVGFSVSAETYVRGRPEYPVEADAWLANDLGLRGDRTALDLGAGTGKFTKRLLATGANVCAVDPVPAMLERLKLQHADLDVRAGSAEAIPFGDSAFDAVVCAQSFHWFATDEAMVEIHRVLKPGGRLGLIWNVRDESIEWVAALTRIIEPFEGDTPRYRTQKWRRVFPEDGFGPLCERKFLYEHKGSAERVIVDRILSVSFIAALDAGAQNYVVSQVRELIAATPELRGKSEVKFPYETVVLNCTKL